MSKQSLKCTIKEHIKTIINNIYLISPVGMAVTFGIKSQYVDIDHELIIKIINNLNMSIRYISVKHDVDKGDCIEVALLMSKETHDKLGFKKIRNAITNVYSSKTVTVNHIDQYVLEADNINKPSYRSEFGGVVNSLCKTSSNGLIRTNGYVNIWMYKDRTQPKKVN